ncbi:MAG: adenine deaminase [Planctomycetes bacterium]|nr:adenine deaminase [Planctomycetota bacterium]
MLRRRVRVARGEEPADLLIAGGRIVNVFTGAVEPGNVSIVDGWIAAVGSGTPEARATVDAAGGVVCPGLIDAHMHIESTLLTPGAFARLVAPRGTSAVIADPHEIGNVLGVPGVELMLAASEGLPVDCFFMAPSCVPASPFENSGADLEAEDLARLMDHERVLGLGEMMNFPGVLGADEHVLAKIAVTHALGRVADGHAPGVLGGDLVAYASAGIRSDHECTTAEEARQRAALGMLVQVREGSMARNLDALLPVIRDEPVEWCLCTDDIHPADLIRDGHLDFLLRRVVAGGVPGPTAVRHASLVPARHYGLRDRGAVTPGYRADLVIFDDLERFGARVVVKDGVVVARDGACVDETPPPSVDVENTVHLASLSESSFKLAIAGEQPVIGIVPDQIVTRHERRAAATVSTSDGLWSFDSQDDLALVACVQRHEPREAVGVGLVRGFGFARHGAIGSSVGHDAHNLVIAGTNPRDMLRCAQRLGEIGGGFVAARDGAVSGELALPFGGLMSTLPAEEVVAAEQAVNAAAADLGCELHSPFGTLSFLPLTVIPELRITDEGVFDVNTFALLE